MSFGVGSWTTDFSGKTPLCYHLLVPQFNLSRVRGEFWLHDPPATLWETKKVPLPASYEGR